jgi:hypothetical protein
VNKKWMRSNLFLYFCKLKGKGSWKSIILHPKSEIYAIPHLTFDKQNYKRPVSYPHMMPCSPGPLNINSLSLSLSSALLCFPRPFICLWSLLTVSTFGATCKPLHNFPSFGLSLQFLTSKCREIFDGDLLFDILTSVT